MRWLQWARDKADWLDPLTAKEDKLLGKSKHIFELIEREDFRQNVFRGESEIRWF